MRILLTGGQGMVGTNIRLHPFFQEQETIAPTRHELDLLNFQKTKDFFKEIKPDFVIHCAGLVGGIHANMERPVDFLVLNTKMGENVFLAARESGIRSGINLASSCMYPRNVEGLLTEDMILKGELEPTNEGYAIGKIWTYRLCSYINQESPEFKYKTLIPCNLFGAFDKFDPKHSHLLPAIIHKLHWAKKNNDRNVEIWGDGKARREFMSVNDLSEAVAFAIRNFDRIPDAVNVGLGYDYSVNDYYTKAAKVIGYQGEFWHNLDRPVGMKQKLVSVEKLKAIGWTSSISLERGIQIAYDYYLSLELSKSI